MSMLTTILLAEAVDKGGPGSGPHPSGMQGAAINHELDRLSDKSSKLTDRMIEAGWGHLRPTEFPKDHALTQEHTALHDRQQALRNEVERRAGPGMSRLPKGFGPLKN